MKAGTSCRTLEFNELFAALGAQGVSAESAESADSLRAAAREPPECVCASRFDFNGRVGIVLRRDRMKSGRATRAERSEG